MSIRLAIAAVARVALVAFAMGALALPGHAGDGTVTARTVSDGFFRTVFGLEYGRSHPDAYRVKRFAGPVRFHVSDRTGLRRAREAQLFLRRLPQEIAGLDARVVATERGANFRVVLARAADFAGIVQRELWADARAMNARCLVGVTTEAGRILSATAVIVADEDSVFRRCLVEEVLQGLGPMNDSDALTHSVFNDSSRHDHFTAFDRAILNILYHPAIQPGMTGGEVQRALPIALRDTGLLR